MTAWKDNAADVVNIKIGKFGGLTKAKRVNKTNSCSLKIKIAYIKDISIIVLLFITIYEHVGMYLFVN